MKIIIKNAITLSISIVGAIGGIIWTIFFDGNIESIVTTIVSGLGIVGFFVMDDDKKNNDKNPNTEQNVSVNVNINQSKDLSDKIDKKQEEQLANSTINRTAIIDSLKSKTKILFIDDDNKFKVVKLLKDSGWKNTKSVVDIKTLDISVVKEADIIFVDINGVGILLNLEYEGLDLSLMLKQKYPEKKIIIYSANKNSNSFHNAWDECDYKLEKNALPFQFQNVVEEYSLEIYKSK